MKAPTVVLSVLLLMVVATMRGQPASAEHPVAWGFVAGDSPVYHLRTLRAQSGARAVVTASYDGSVACFTPEGRPLWRAAATGGFPFDLAVADLDGDGRDEVLVAAGDGALRVYDHAGALRWTFARTAPLYQVCVARGRAGRPVVLTGGIEQVLYALSPQGEVLQRLQTEHVIRHLRAGDVLGGGEDAVAMATTSSGLTGILKLFLLDPHDLTVRWQHADLSVRGMNPGKRFFSLLVTDLNRDGKAEVMLSGGWRENGAVHAYDATGRHLFTRSDPRIPSVPYRMNYLRKVTVPGDDYVLGHFGNLLILYENDGTLRETVTGPYSFADSHYDPELRTLFMGSAVSGGTEVYAYRLDRPGWKQAFVAQRALGRLAEIERNLATLNRQIRDFRAPAYQPAPRPVLAITQPGETRDFRHVAFASSITLSQKVENPDELWCRERDRRMPYRHTADELAEIIAEKEAKGENVLVWAGHGNAVFFPLATFERLLKAGPKHLKGFVFAEMEGTGESTREVVEKILFPLAELCRAHGKIVFFRNKNIFWNGTCYLPFWSRVLLDEKYRDVFVPALEETNGRSQDLSLAGRVGLWQSGAFNRWACRTVTDDANFNRMFEWGGQQIVHHHLRNLVSTAALGADIFLSDIHAGVRGTPLRVTEPGPAPEAERRGNSAYLFDQLMPFYRMLEKGIVQIPTRGNLLSQSGFALVMRAPPADRYLRHGVNGHRYSFPQDGDPTMVFSRLDAYWGGARLQASDFSAYAMNVRLRTCNFLPELPYGLVPIIPAAAAGRAGFVRTVETDGERFYDDAGRSHDAADFKPQIEQHLRAAAAELPLTVAGPAHWAAARLDAKHIRVTLIDPGYLDPAARAVELIFQHVRVKHGTDILSGERLTPVDRRLAVTIPAGVFRIIDLEVE
ncbi:MAG: PQQ-binding-like beta-propeller repeat protein [Opitutaceae bacterium]|nr:PQQ-binding-like beta-propeller repeat protein [Opitutaceae bacterium]